MKASTKNKACIGGAIFVLAVSILAIIAGVFVVDFVDDAINDAVEKGLQITASDEADNSESWIKWRDSDVDFLYYLFDYTNIDDVLVNGAKPVVAEAPAQTWREFNYRYNIDFEDGLVYYNQYWTKVPVNDTTTDPPRSNTAYSPSTKLTTMNPVYWGLSSQVYALIKQSLFESFLARAPVAQQPAFSPGNEFPLGLLGPLLLPTNITGVGLPFTNVIIPKRDTLISNFAGGLTLAGIHGAMVAQGSTLQNLLPYLAGYHRRFQDATYGDANSGARMPLYEAETTLATVATHMLAAGNAYAAADADFPGMRACSSFSLTNATQCGIAVSLVNAGVPAVPASVIGAFGALFLSPLEEYSMGSSSSALWSAAAAGDATSIGQLTYLYKLKIGNLTGSDVPIAAAGAVVTSATAWLSGSVYNPSVNPDFEANAVAGYRLLIGDQGINAAYTAQGGTQPFNEALVDAVQTPVVNQVNYLFLNAAGDTLASTFEEVGYAHFARGAAFGGASSITATGGPASHVRGGDVYYGPEFGPYQKAKNVTNGAAGFIGYDLAYDQAKLWLDPLNPQSLANSSAWGALLLDNFVGAQGNLFAGSVMRPLSDYGITSANYAMVWKYVGHYLPFHELIYTYMIAENFGPFFEVTPAELLLGNAAPPALVVAFQPLSDDPPNNPGLITSYANSTDHQDRTHQARYVQYSGIGSQLDLVRQFKAYRGSESFDTLRQASGNAVEQAGPLYATATCVYSEIGLATGESTQCAAWRSVEVIDGSSPGNNFAPFGEDRDPAKANYRVFIAEGQRVIDTTFDKTESVKGIKVHRFVAPESVTARATNSSHPNYKYRMETSPTGIVPMHLFARGLPAAVSRPHFWTGDQSLLIDRITGLNPVPDLHTTYIDVEPLTGATMRGAKRFQNNLLATPEANDFDYFQNMWDSIPAGEDKFFYLPWYWGTETGIIDDSDASDFRKGVYDNRDLADTLAIVFLVVGVALAATSTVCLIYYCRRKGDAEGGMPTRLDSKTNL